MDRTEPFFFFGGGGFVGNQEKPLTHSLKNMFFFLGGGGVFQLFLFFFCFGLAFRHLVSAKISKV